ncbi:Flavinator of succinate dehydrogenase-domain-containing protein, partial [Protomyces lactucae-debilis]
QDPYPLVGRGNAGPIEMDETLVPHTPIDRSHETTNTKRARLLWQSRKRGILETDLLLSTFAAKALPEMDATELELYDKLLDEPDWEIYYYATGKKPAPAAFEGSQLMERLKQHTANEEKQTRSMPSL